MFRYIINVLDIANKEKATLLKCMLKYRTNSADSFILARDCQPKFIELLRLLSLDVVANPLKEK